MIRPNPSNANIWMKCPGYVRLGAIYPPIPGDDKTREEGLAFHWLLQKLLRNDVVYIGDISPNGMALTAEMFDDADDYVELVRSWSVGAHLQIPLPINVESVLPVPALYNVTDCRIDAWVYDPVLRKIYIADAKYGHRYTDVYRNWQLLCNVSAILSALNIDGFNEQSITVDMFVYQPRNYSREGPIRKWSTNAASLRGFFNMLIAGAEKAVDPEAPTVAGAQCIHCSARHACEAAQRASMEAVDIAGQAVPLDLPPSAIGFELALLDWAADIIKARRTGLEAQAIHMLRDGAVITQYELEQGHGRETWKPEQEATVRGLGKMLNVEVANPGKLRTPKQLREAMPAMSEVISNMAWNPPGEIKLRKTDPYRAERIFNQGK